jgi:hypothetical protein
MARATRFAEKHGSLGCSEPMKRYRIEYRDEDPGCPVFCAIVRAHDRDHAIERFLDAPDGEGWVIVKVTLDPARQRTA